MRSPIEWRLYLKSKGWKREDRRNEELWIRPWNGIGYRPMGITLVSAIRRQKRADNEGRTDS